MGDGKRGSSPLLNGLPGTQHRILEDISLLQLKTTTVFGSKLRRVCWLHFARHLFGLQRREKFSIAALSQTLKGLDAQKENRLSYGKLQQRNFSRLEGQPLSAGFTKQKPATGFKKPSPRNHHKLDFTAIGFSFLQAQNQSHLTPSKRVPK